MWQELSENDTVAKKYSGDQKRGKENKWKVQDRNSRLVESKPLKAKGYRQHGPAKRIQHAQEGHAIPDQQSSAAYMPLDESPPDCWSSQPDENIQISRLEGHLNRNLPEQEENVKIDLHEYPDGVKHNGPLQAHTVHEATSFASEKHDTKKDHWRTDGGQEAGWERLRREVETGKRDT